jgi:hypothetical protein
LAGGWCGVGRIFPGHEHACAQGLRAESKLDA